MAILRHPGGGGGGLTQAVAPHAKLGLLDAIAEPKRLPDVLVSEPESGLLFVPSVTNREVLHTSEILSSAGMRGILNEASKFFEYIVVDLPPLGPVVDVRAAASLFDAFVLVVEWGRTSRAVADNSLVR